LAIALQKNALQVSQYFPITLFHIGTDIISKPNEPVEKLDFAALSEG